jgi:hypothetical protein
VKFGDWECRIVDNFDMMSVDIYFSRRTPAGRELLNSKGKIVLYKPGQVVTGDNHFARLEREQIKALADELHKYGVKTASDDKNEGLLEATREHLSDMRRLVFEQPHESIRNEIMMPPDMPRMEIKE